MTELANWVATGMPTNYNVARPASASIPTTRGAIRARRRRRPPGAGHRRLELGHRHRGQLLGGQRRHRDVGLDPQPGQPDHAGRRSSRRSAASAATASSRSPPTRTRRDRWPARSPTPRSCSACSKARRPIRTTPATAACAPPPDRDYTRFLRPRALTGRAHRHPARLLLRRGVDARRPRPGGGLSRGAGARDDRGDRASRARRARRSSIRPTSRRSSRTDAARSLLRWPICSGAGDAKGMRRRLLDRLQVRDEARLQRLAGARSARRRRCGR